MDIYKNGELKRTRNTHSELPEGKLMKRLLLSFPEAGCGDTRYMEWTRKQKSAGI